MVFNTHNKHQQWPNDLVTASKYPIFNQFIAIWSYRYFTWNQYFNKKRV